MLEKLGQALKGAINKIAGAIFVDRKLIDGVIKELQKALIEADVNVQLVFEISEELKKAAANEKIKGIEKKEHIIKLLNDKIIEILGGEKKELVLGKKTKLMLLGLYGSGKCVHGKSNIQLASGEMIKIKELYENYKNKFQEEKIEDGEIINISRENLLVPSFNSDTCKIENKKATHIWKLNKKELIEIRLDNGNDFSIKVTPEHPFFVLRDSKITKIRADEIKEYDYIAVPNEIKIDGTVQSLFNDLKNLDIYVYLTPEEIKQNVLYKYKTLKEVCQKLKFKKNYCKLTSDIKNGKIPIELLKKENFNIIKVKDKEAANIITVPLFLTAEFAEFLGYLMGDGHIGKNYIEIVSEDQEIIDRIIELSKILFNILPKVKKDIRTRKMYKIQLSSKTIVTILSIFNLNPGKKGKELKIPKQIFLSKEDVIRSFIRAYFDCDSYPSNNKRVIELLSESHILIQQMNLLLERFGILSTISKKLVKNVPYWRLSIKAKYAERYAEKIGYIIEKKQKKVVEYQKIGIIQGYGNQDMIPLGKALKKLRMQLGFSIGEIQTNAVLSYGRYEESGLISKGNLIKLVQYYKYKKRGIFLNFLEDLNNNMNIKERYSKSFINGTLSYLKKKEIIDYNNKQIILLENGKKYLKLIKENKIESQKLLNIFEFLATSNVCWFSTNEIRTIKNEEDFVYDLTIEDNHSFIANNIIVHNTTTIGKLAAYYSKRGRKVCAIGLDVHRPAAPEQLEQVCKPLNIPCFIDKQEKSPEKIWQKYKAELEKYDLVLIDTAGRDALSKELIDEIKKLEKLISPEHILLVMPSDIGQAARKQASEFQKACKITGTIITRMDSSAKGGGALTSCYETKAPVYFIGIGEKAGDIEPFNPKSFVSRLLGMGDLETLVEKVKSAVEEKEQKKLKSRLEEGKFTMDDLYEQLKSMQNIGPLGKIAELIPGFGKVKVPEEMLDLQEEKLKKWKFAIDSMTRDEKENPEIIEKQTSRISRIAKGAGINTSDVRALLKQYKIIKEFAKTGKSLDISQGFSQKQLQKLAKKFGKKIRI